MNIIKIGLALITGAGFGFGVDKLADTEMFPNDNDGYSYMEEDYEGHMGEERCISDGDFLQHMTNYFTDEELLLVQGKIDELLVEYSITIEELNEDYNVKFTFMNDLMQFLDENEIIYHNYGRYHDQNDEDGWHGGMGMH